MKAVPAGVKNAARTLRIRAKLFYGSARAKRLLICAAGSLVILALFMVSVAPVRYDIRIGTVPSQTISATKDVVDVITTEKRRMAASFAVSPTYHYIEGVEKTVLSTFDSIFAQLRAVRQYVETLPDVSENRVYSADELTYARTMLTLLSMRDYQLRTLMNTTLSDLDTLYTSLYAAIQNTMAGYVTQGLEDEAISSILQIVGYRTDTSLLTYVVQPVLKTCITANMVIDQEATEAARQAASAAVEDVLYKKGQNIVVKGEGRVEEYQYAMLASLGLLTNSTADANIYIGAAVLVAATLLIMLMLLHVSNRKLMEDPVRLALLFIIMIFTLSISTAARLLSIYLAPAVLCAMLLSSMLGLRAAIVCNIAVSILVSMLAAGREEIFTSEMSHIFITSMISGVFVSLVLSRKSTRVRVIITGFAAGAINFIMVLALGMITGNPVGSMLKNALLCTAGGIAAALLCIGAQPLLEASFNLPTPTRLMELSNPNQPLMRRLLLEAPGTYHHSIIVANLAEAAAEAVGANPLLARIGGYYHDVGKLKRPQYFRENQIGSVNALNQTDPQVSAAIVTAHTRDGVALARQYRLPSEVVDLIARHHGNTPVMCFYQKAVELANGKPVDIDTFRYDSKPPETKEGAIVLLCDTIEAAVRSMQNPTPDSIEEFIVKLIKGKLVDGQLSNSPLTLRDIDSVGAACTTVLNGVFHERIEYPDAEVILSKDRNEQRRSFAPPVPLPDGDISQFSSDDISAVPPLNAIPKTHVSLVEPQQFDDARPLEVVPPPSPQDSLALDSLLVKKDAKDARNVS